MDKQLKFEYGHPDDRPLLSSANQMKDLATHVGWQDIRGFFEDRIEIYLKMLEVADSIDEVRKIQTAISLCRDIVELPDQLIKWILQQEEGNEDVID